MIKLATLFSGIGAIEEALKQMKLKYEIVFACDNGERELSLSYDEIIKKSKSEKNDINQMVNRLYDETNKINYVEKSYKENYKINEEDFYQDIRFLDAKKYNNKIDILVGGSPCQSFSVNGKRKGFDDIRGTLFYDYIRIIREAEPKVFIFENVKGMITHDEGRTWNVVKEKFNLLDYNIYIKKDSKGKESPILNSVNYGIPQKRDRLFVVGIRKDIKLKKEFKFPNEIELSTKIKDYLDEKVDAKYYLGQKGFEFVTTHPSRAQVGCDIMRCQKANQQFNWNGDFIFEEYEKIKERKDVLEKAYIGKFEGKKGVIRKFTPRECMRLMGFSDNYKIIVDDQNAYRQAGNSIVVNVLKCIVKEIKATGVWEE